MKKKPDETFYLRITPTGKKPDWYRPAIAAIMTHLLVRYGEILDAHLERKEDIK
jgi:hypothetical protein